MLFGFLSISWPEMCPWYMYTGAQIRIAKLLSWKVDKSVSRFSMIPDCIKPTQIQLTSIYPTIIDWVPFPNIRDRLILYHANNVRLDEIIYDLIASIVIEAAGAQLVEGLFGKVYVSVWDLVKAMQLPNQSCMPAGLARDSVRVLLPAPTVEGLLSSREYASQALELLNADQVELVWRIDPAFLDRHPELYDPQTHTMAEGQSLRLTMYPVFPEPLPLDGVAAKRYGDLASQIIDNYFSTSLSPEIFMRA